MQWLLRRKAGSVRRCHNRPELWEQWVGETAYLGQKQGILLPCPFNTFFLHRK